MTEKEVLTATDEWLKNLKNLLSSVSSENQEYVQSRIELLERLQEQVERVQELERKIERYREALEFYANEETYETKFATDTDEICDPFTLIELDEGKRARQALEGNDD